MPGDSNLFVRMTERSNHVLGLTSADLTKIFYISPSYETVWGRSCQSLYDQPRSWLEGVHPDDRSRVMKELEQSLNGTRHDMVQSHNVVTIAES